MLGCNGLHEYAPGGAVCVCVIYMCSMTGVGVQVVADCRAAHQDAIGQCTPVKGWVEVGTAGLVGIMPFELGRRSLRGLLRSCRQGPLGCRRSRARERASSLLEQEEGRLGLWSHGRACVGGRCSEKRSDMEGEIAAQPGVVMIQAVRGWAVSRRSQVAGRGQGRGREGGSRRKAQGTAPALVDLVPSCRRVHGRQLEGKLEIRSSKRSWTI